MRSLPRVRSRGSPVDRFQIDGSGALGDVIVQADGKPVHRLSDLTDQIEQVGAGKSVRITLKRGSDTRDVNIDIVDIGRG
jgi:2-alkenal reductase